MSELMLKSVYDLLDKNYFIPSYQRGYRWEKRQIQDLLEDLYNFACDKDKTDGSFYCLQPIVVKKCDEVTKVSNDLQSELDNNEWYEVIDGQQRLTSLYLLLKYLIDTDRCDLYTDYGKHLFRLSYQTRCTDTNYISDPSTPSNSSPNAYYITEGYKNISEWFTAVPETKNIPQVKKVRNRFMELLTNTKDEYNENGYVQVIWYETSDPDPIKTFTRLNIGKIPLKNAELIKALFLQKRDDSEVSNIQQIQIAKEWDQIEATLQNKRIWAFLNKDLPDMPAHIEFIFDVIFSVDGDIEKDQLGKDEYLKIHGAQPNENVKKQRIEKTKLGERKFADKYGTDEYASFRFFSARFENVDRSIIESEWDKVREYYETFAEWYNNPLWYHYIGFLIYCGEPITSIYKLYKDKTKVEFAENLISAIKCKLKVTDLVDWMQQYGAIRYKDNYISRPSSSYDWIYVYGYSNEIITELIARGWSCENTCNIGEEPNKKDIPYYWSAAGREIDVSKSVCNNGNTVLQRCSVGNEEITLMVDDTIIEALNYNALVTDVSGIKKFVDDIEKKYNDKICGGI